MKKLLLLGASGNIGEQTIDILTKERENFSLIGFSVGHNYKKIKSILKKFPEVEALYLIDDKKALKIQKLYPGIKVFSGEHGLIELIHATKPDLTVNAILGFAGVLPSIETLKLKRKLALANKESLVVAGDIVNDLLAKGKGKLIPIDSEHCAIAKCLAVDNSNVDELWITASGGAFRFLTREKTKDLKKEDALRHPTWKMGDKITIDSATMVNKCFEVIEAYYLFNIPFDKIKVVMHESSRVHSIVKYKDGTLRADISKPNMKNPIFWAIHEGEVSYKTYTAKDINSFGDYKFWDFDINRYPLMKYAKIVLEHKGIYGTVLNACNEVAVKAFLNDEIGFLEIDDVINECMKNVPDIKQTVSSIVKYDKKTRELARHYIETRKD